MVPAGSHSSLNGLLGPKLLTRKPGGDHPRLYSVFPCNFQKLLVGKEVSHGRYRMQRWVEFKGTSPMRPSSRSWDSEKGTFTFSKA